MDLFSLYTKGMQDLTRILDTEDTRVLSWLSWYTNTRHTEEFWSDWTLKPICKPWKQEQLQSEGCHMQSCTQLIASA